MEVADAVCPPHKDAVIEAAVDLELDLNCCGVRLLDMEPRNVILLPPEERRDFCASLACPLRFEADYKKLEILMIDFELVEFSESGWAWTRGDRGTLIDSLKPSMLEGWLEGLAV